MFMDDMIEEKLKYCSVHSHESWMVPITRKTNVDHRDELCTREQNRLDIVKQDRRINSIDRIIIYTLKPVERIGNIKCYKMMYSQPD